MFATARLLAGDGGVVVVGLDSDRKVRESKGEGRPVNPFADRKVMLEAVRYIDRVYQFDTREELENLLELMKPDIMLLGGDWRYGDVVGREHALEVRFLDRRQQYSTTNIIERCRNDS